MNSKNLQEFEIGDNVRVQNKNKEWESASGGASLEATEAMLP